MSKIAWRGICAWRGRHQFDRADPYGRLGKFHAVDGCGRHHRDVEMQCDRCGAWVRICKIHTTKLEASIDVLHRKGVIKQ